MKLTTLLLFVALMNVSAATLAQRVTIKEKKITLDKVFREIRKQTGYDVLVSTDKLNTDKTIDANFENMPLSDILDELLKGSGLSYLIKDKTIVIQEKKEAPTIQPNAPPVTITGKVTDELGEPMAGVTVKQKDNPTNGTVTDDKGNYTLNVPDNKSVISFSFIGYETQELKAVDIPAGAVIILKPAENNLREVVINKGYYDEKRELSTANVSVVGAKTIEEQPVSDPIQALIGRVPGLNIQQTSGLAGAYSTIHIEGLNSISNGNDPLYIIDGVPFNSMSLSGNLQITSGALGLSPGTATYNTNGGGLSPFNGLNLEDIENIEILKDADATAIYGSRGANGVILITTKKGRAGASRFTLDANQGAGQVGHFMDLLNTQQYLAMRQQAYINDGQTPNIANGDYDLLLWDTTRYTNWQKTLIGGTATWTNINGELSGGNANTQFLIGAGYNRQTTVYPGDYADTKKSMHVSITHTSDNQKFHEQFTAGYVNDGDILPNGDLTSTALTLAPDAPELYSPNGGINWQIYNGTSTFSNPLAQTVNSTTLASNTLISSLDLSYRLLPGLTLKSTFGYNHGEMNETQLTLDASYAPPNNINPARRRIAYGNSVSQNWIVEPQLTYDHKIAQGTFSALIGTDFEHQSQEGQGYAVSGFASDVLVTDPAAGTTFIPEGATDALYRYNAVYARIGYNWEDKYLLNITARRDGSSRFGPGRQWGNFGAIGGGWIFSKEKFVENNLPWLNFGKLRGSYGTTGSDQIGNYGYIYTYSAGSTTYQGITQLLPNGLPNPSYGWETDKKLDLAMDLGFLKDRINLTLDWYRNRSSDQLVSEPLPSFTGSSNITENLPATVQNTGFLVDLHTIDIKEKEFSWSSGINFTFPENKLVAFPNFATSTFASNLAIGQPITILHQYQYMGVNPQTGNYTFATQMANGTLNLVQGDIVNPTQKFYGGMQNSFSYKNFSLDIFIQFVKQTGHNWQYYWNSYPLGYVNSNQPTAVLGAWQTPGQIATIQKGSAGLLNYTQYNDFTRSSGAFTDDSFIRLKNVSMSYRLPTAWQHWLGMSAAKFYVQGQNLYTFTKYIGLDPETAGMSLPPLRMITAGFSASF